MEVPKAATVTMKEDRPYQARLALALFALAGMLLGLLASISLASAGTCILTGDQCFNATYSTDVAPPVGYDGSQSQCIAYNSSRWVTVDDIDTIPACLPGCCCGGNQPWVKQIDTLCPDTAPILVSPGDPAYDPSDATCAATCQNLPPPGNLCPSDALVDATTDGCTCGGDGVATAGEYCCWNNELEPDQASCAPEVTACGPGQSAPASGCSCGGTVITTGVCCADGTTAPTVGQCSQAPPPGAQCGNLVLDAGEACDAEYTLDISGNLIFNQGIGCPAAPAGPPGSPTIPTPYCTAACTCVPQTVNGRCGNGLCEKGEDVPGSSNQCQGQSGGPNDCPAFPTCAPDQVGAYPLPTNFAGVYDATSAPPRVSLNWDTPATCTDVLLSYTIRRSIVGPQQALSAPDIPPVSLPPTAKSHVDSAIPSTVTTNLYYAITAYYDVGTAIVFQSKTIAVNIPNQDCPAADISYCADGRTPINCANWVKLSTQPCTASETCTVGAPGSGPSQAYCTPAADCSLCNGLFGSFPDDNLRIPEGGDPLTAPRVACKDATTCYKDLGNTSVELYLSCKTINSCIGYRTEDACELNSCQKPGDCDWEPIGATGRGVCKPTDPYFTECTECNALGIGSGCIKDVCESISPRCYYNIDTGTDGVTAASGAQSLEGCFDIEDVPCEFFNTQDECEGNPATQYDIDVAYGTNGLRSDGTHQASALSADKAQHGKCVWDPGPAVCEKNADESSLADIRQWNPNQGVPLLSSLLDFTSPVTSVLGVPNQVYPAVFRLPFMNASEVWTTFCRASELVVGSVCYPQNSSLVNGTVVGAFNPVTDSDDWVLRFYGKDVSQNLEVVQSFPFTIDARKPAITIDPPVTNIVVLVPSTLRTQAYVTFNVSELARCTTRLQDSTSGAAVYTGAARTANELVDSYGQDFSITYPALQDGRYELNVTCTDGAGNSGVAFVSIRADSDPRITHPSPNASRPPLATRTVSLRIETQLNASCKYGPRGQPYAQMADYTATGATVHTASFNAIADRTYVLQTACIINSTVVYGDTADDIMFSIDTAAPTTLICDPDTSDIIAGTCGQFDASPAADYRVLLLCQDEPRDLVNFGCDITNIRSCTYDTATASTCQPSLQNPIIGPISGDNDHVLRYFSVDAGGNAEGTRSQTLQTRDFTPPNAPDFTITP